MSRRDTVLIDNSTGCVETLPLEKGKRYRCKLDTTKDIQHEMGRVYKEARSFMLDVQDASKLVYMLGSIGKLIETSDVVDRLEKLEDRQ